MKYFIISILMTCSFTLLSGVTACSPDNTEPPPEIPVPPGNNEGGDKNGVNNGNENNDLMEIQVKIGLNTYTATLTDNTTAAAFREMLPLTLHMEDVNRNEKFIRLPGSLPTAASNPGTIHTGDIMLYGSAGLVLFYKTFSTSYSYTRIGAIVNPSGLEAALGTGNITITFE